MPNQPETSPRTRRPVVAVVGSASATAGQRDAALAVGRGVIELGARLVTGGLGGVMAAASEGARNAAQWGEGDIIGILPGYVADRANEWVDIAIPSGLGYARNVLVVASADVVVAVGGGSGTLSEMALARNIGRPVVAIASTRGTAARAAAGALGLDGIEAAKDPEDALRIVARLLGLSRAS